MEKTWKSVVAGVCDMIGGAFGLIFGIMFIFSGALFQAQTGLAFFGGVAIVPGILLVIFGIVAIIGGLQAFKRKKWALALTGSILALFPNFGVGVLAIVFTALSKNEFEQS